MRPFLSAAFTLIVLALTACGKQVLPEKPQLVTDRDSIGFAQEFGSGTFIGTKPQESLYLENGGLQDLVIESVTKTGPDAAAFELTGPTKTTLKGLERAFLRIVFTPTAERVYNATITIKSNAENAPTKDIPVSGRGIVPTAD